ncbi:MAG: hypothetical protein ACRDF4_02200, partial [Rhabdochlamydiaceae bacterium]
VILILLAVFIVLTVAVGSVFLRFQEVPTASTSSSLTTGSSWNGGTSYYYYYALDIDLVYLHDAIAPRNKCDNNRDRSHNILRLRHRHDSDMLIDAVQYLFPLLR